MPTAIRSSLPLDLTEHFLICQIISHLARLNIPGIQVDSCGRHRIFYNGAQKRIRQVHTSLIHQKMQFRHKPERLCISFKMIQILYHLPAHHLFHRLSMICHKWQLPFEPLPDHIFSKMPKGRIPDIVNQPCALQNITYIFFHLWCKLRIFFVN